MKESLEDTKTIPYWKQFRKTRLAVDSSPFALWAILKQKLEQSDIPKAVACASQSLTKVEQNMKHLLLFGVVSIFSFHQSSER